MIQFFYETDFNLSNEVLIEQWIQKVVEEAGHKLGDVTYVFCNDAYLLDINTKFLNHDTYTDIISFDYGVGKIVNGEIYISVDRVQENAKTYAVTEEEEFYRVIIHGILHFLGQSDKTAERKIYNTHVIINNKGQIKSYYHKIHLFDVSIPNKVNLQESKTTLPGDKLVVCDSPIGKLGLSICFDMRFPEMYIKMVQDMGAEVLLMPSAFTVPTGKAHWHALLRGEKGKVYTEHLYPSQYILILLYS